MSLHSRFTFFFCHLTPQMYKIRRFFSVFHFLLLSQLRFYLVCEINNSICSFRFAFFKHIFGFRLVKPPAAMTNVHNYVTLLPDMIKIN